jgi:hypothetical protein
VTANPLDAARDALIALQGQLIAVLAAQNAALAAQAGLSTAIGLAHSRRRAGGAAGEAGARGVAELGELLVPAVDG